MYSSKELRTIGELCIKHDVLILSDDVYERIAYGSSYTCIASLDQAIAARTLTTISVGKLFNATGWRLGFVIGPKALMRHVIGVHLTLAYASTSPTQEAAAVGLREAGKNGFWERNKKDVQHRVSTICDVLEEIGLAVSSDPQPSGNTVPGLQLTIISDFSMWLLQAHTSSLST